MRLQLSALAAVAFLAGCASPSPLPGVAGAQLPTGASGSADAGTTCKPAPKTATSLFVANDLNGDVLEFTAPYK
ncbi:MAG TPA: hypothetical protein VGF18_07640, partial [Candidatus Tumulicola sp.]